jgi:hypothetical protein
LEAYTVGIIAELVGFTHGHTEKAYQLQKTKDMFPLDTGKLPVHGNINLWLQLVYAKMQSDINWRFDKTYDEIHATLGAVDQIINYLWRSL